MGRPWDPTEPSAVFSKLGGNAIPSGFLHVGLPKTASTLLQEKLFLGHPGIACLGAPFKPRNPHFHPDLERLDWMLTREPSGAFDADRGQELLRGRLGRVQTGEVAVFSDETMTRLDHVPRYTKALRARRVFDEWRVVLCLRQQQRLLQSAYRQVIRHLNKGKGGRFKEYGPWVAAVWKKLDEGGYASLVLLDEVVEMYVGLFGRENVHVLFHEDLVVDARHFVRELCELLGVDADAGISAVGGQKVHVGLTDAQMDFVRTFDAVVDATPGYFRRAALAYLRDVDLPVSDALMGEIEALDGAFREEGSRAIVARLELELWPTLASGPTSDLRLPPELEAEMNETFRRTNRLLESRFGLPVRERGYLV